MPPGCGPHSRATTSGAVHGDRASVGQISAHFLISEVELILCNNDEKMKKGTTPLAPHAPTPKRQCPRCGGAWQRRLLCVATTTPQSRHSSAQGRHQLRVALCHSSVGSRFSLKQPLGVSRGGTASARGFLSRWSLEPEGCMSPSPSPGSSLPWSCCRQASTSATTHGGPVPAPRRGGAAPAPRWSRRTTALLHAPCSSKRAPILPLCQGVKLASAHYEQPSGWLPTAAGNGRATPIQSQRSCSHAI